MQKFCSSKNKCYTAFFCTLAWSETVIFRLKAAIVTDKRIKVMNEIISGIRVIKMYGWEYAFSQLINKIRR